MEAVPIVERSCAPDLPVALLPRRAAAAACPCGIGSDHRGGRALACSRKGLHAPAPVMMSHVLLQKGVPSGHGGDGRITRRGTVTAGADPGMPQG